MARLPQFENDGPGFRMMQTTWSTLIDPLLSNPANQTVLLKSITLRSGDNAVNHLLGRKLQGWHIVRARSAATFYDKQDANSMPELTLALNASANCVVDLLVF